MTIEKELNNYRIQSIPAPPKKVTVKNVNKYLWLKIRQVI
jgi:hypothetical protein